MALNSTTFFRASRDEICKEAKFVNFMGTTRDNDVTCTLKKEYILQPAVRKKNIVSSLAYSDFTSNMSYLSTKRKHLVPITCNKIWLKS